MAIVNLESYMMSKNLEQFMNLTHAKWNDIQIDDAMKGFHRRESE